MAKVITTELQHSGASSANITLAADGSVTLPADTVDIATLSATGTASSSTFLRGDNAWAAAGGGKVVKHAYQTYSTQNNTSSNSYTATGLTIDYTPVAANNILYVICMQQCYVNSNSSNGDARGQWKLEAAGNLLATTQFEGSSSNSNSENTGVETLVGKYVAPNTNAVTIDTEYKAVSGNAYSQHGSRNSNLIIIEVEP